VFTPALPRVRAVREGTVAVGHHRLPALALALPAPGSYTGEDTVELHVPGSPLLCRLLQDALQSGPPGEAVRAALPGEFTRRAFANGRMDLGQAEGVLMLIHGQTAADARVALSWLSGGMSAAVAALRHGLQDTAAVLEAGLDFEEGETGAVAVADWLPGLGRARERTLALLQSLPAAHHGGEVLLLGAANAGKSSLCNALCGREAVLVDASPGTTRDLLRVPIGDGVCLWDAPGDLAAPGALDRAALRLRERVGAGASAALFVVDPARPVWPATELPVLGVVFTKQDLGAPAVDAPAGMPCFRTSAVTGAGLADLRSHLARHAVAGVRDPGGPIRSALAAAAAALERAEACSAGGRGAEEVAFELAAALRALDGIDGAHSPEDLLDRIFGRFCLGK
jgi:tRNA modification GTPase